MARALERTHSDDFTPAGYSPSGLGNEALPAAPDAEQEELVAIAAAEMDRLYEQISGSGYVLLLTDTDGNVLYGKVDPALNGAFRPAPRVELTCCAAPIRSPADTVIAMLDAVSVGAHDSRAGRVNAMALLRLSAHVIEKCLFLRHYRHRVVLRFHDRPELVDVLHDGVLALADDGTVIGADRTAARLLEVRDRYELVGRAIDEIFDACGERFLPLEMLKGEAPLPVCDRLRGRRFYISLHGGSRSRANEASPVRRTPEIVHVTPIPAPCLTLEELAGEDPQMLRNVRSAYRVADSSVSVLIQGPTGSGKEAFAHAMHLISRRANRPFVAVNCAAIPETLIESELFGYRPGAFTGARKDGMKGKILQSSGGTLFLDEIGDMPLALQTRLLRVLEEKEIVPLGSETPIKVDLHVIAASHRNLREMIARGLFREDLYYRLNGITLELPALAERADRERVIHRVLAAETANGRPAAIEVDALQQLVRYPWPGNIRELRNVIRTALAICEGGVIRLIDLPREVREAPRIGDGDARSLNGHSWYAAASARPVTPLQAAECEALLRTVKDCRGNITRAAGRLGVSRNTLYRKMKLYGIRPGHT